VNDLVDIGWFNKLPVFVFVAFRFSKLDPHEFIVDLESLAIICVHGDADKRSGRGRPMRTPKPHWAIAGIDRTAPSSCRSGAQPNSSPVFPAYRLVALALAVILVAAMVRKPCDQ
jgi:hypothetical protein